MILLGDCLERLKELPDNSVDSVVTDPPYGLKFMGKRWDYDVPNAEVFGQVLRVLKPGGHLLAFAGTRTYHRMAVNIEDAGFEIRDQLQWIYGSGFPKSQNISIQIDKQAGAMGDRGKAFVTAGQDGRDDLVGTRGVAIGGHDPITEHAKQWQGFGTALKPANEPICLARKPLSESTVAKNVLKWGTGGLNIDACRIGTDQIEKGRHGRGECESEAFGKKLMATGKQFSQGRWPANLILDERAAELLDEQSGPSGGTGKRTTKKQNSMGYHEGDKVYDDFSYADSGGASRFFYVAKASKRERNFGLEGMPEKDCTAKQQNSHGRMENGVVTNAPPIEPKSANHHPTVKPIKLMQYLIKLITPPGGTVLDPFAGSGSTLVAAKSLGFESIGIEMNEQYVEIAEKRVAAVSL